MFDPTIIFQRSHTGRNEIYEKKCGLTQSERLVLIMIDGVTSYSGVRSKLPALTDERFSRAVNTLLKKELILEVFMPVEGQEVEEVESAVVDRFLQQDPTDPLTIISFDPDEEFGVFGRPISPPGLAQEAQAAMAESVASVEPSPPVQPHIPELHQQAALGGRAIVVGEIGTEPGAGQRSCGFSALACGSGADPTDELPNDHGLSGLRNLQRHRDAMPLSRKINHDA